MLKTNVRSSLLRGSGVVFAAALTPFAVACEGTPAEGGDEPAVEVPANTGDAVKNYSAIVLASYEDSRDAAAVLDSAIDALIAAPTQLTLDAARQAWLDAREPYLQTEVYRFYDGPIDNPTDGPEGLLNAWPMDEKYVDYILSDADAGLINDSEFVINEQNLVDANEDGGEENISTGYHAIEFLLWGQDLSDDGPGERPFADYVQLGGTDNADRRADYLKLTSELLLADLDFLIDSWKTGTAGNYRAEFDAVEPKEGLRRIMTGMIILSGFETGGERLQAALDSGDQEDEHSCFSDNTHRDMIQDIQGVLNVYLGSYEDIDGLGVFDVLNAVDADLAETIQLQIETSLLRAQALREPFDQEIATDNAEGRARVTELITALRDQEKSLEEAFTLFGLDIPVAE